MEEQIDEVTENLTKLEEVLKAFDGEEYLILRDKLDDSNKAKISTSLAFSIASLYYVALSLQGKDPTQHSIIDEIGRIRSVVSLLTPAKKDENQPPKRPRIDKEASQRLIVHNL
eukprot:gene5744-6177_t